MDLEERNNLDEINTGERRNGKLEDTGDHSLTLKKCSSKLPTPKRSVTAINQLAALCLPPLCGQANLVSPFQSVGTR